MITRVIQIGIIAVAAYLFVAITGIAGDLPKPPIIDAAPRDQVIILPTAKVVPAPKVTYVTATPSDVNNVQNSPVIVIVEPEPTALPEGVGIDEVKLGPVDPVQANVEVQTAISSPDRVECTTEQWQKLSKQNYPNPSGCTVITDITPVRP